MGIGQVIEVPDGCTCIRRDWVYESVSPTATVTLETCIQLLVDGNGPTSLLDISMYVKYGACTSLAALGQAGSSSRWECGLIVVRVVEIVERILG